jgi:hypothetical protein
MRNLPSFSFFFITPIGEGYSSREREIFSFFFNVRKERGTLIAFGGGGTLSLSLSFLLFSPYGPRRIRRHHRRYP